LLSTFTVTSALDDGSSGTLRSTIAAAPAGSMIQFHSSLQGDTIAVASQLEINKNLDIEGLGASNLTISGGGTTRVFLIDTGVTATLAQLSIANGSADNGGGVYSTGNLTVSGVTFTDNTATASFPYYGEGGGAIDSADGTLAVTNSMFIDNRAPSGGGGAIEASNELSPGSLMVDGSTFTGNVAGGGGAIQDSFTTMTVSNSSFTSNSGILYAGAIDNGTSNATVTNSMFTADSAPFAGAINNYNALSLGGSLAVSGSTCIGNTATNGPRGAIYNTLGYSSGVRTITNCSFSGNQASSGGGAIWTNPTYGGSGAGLVVTVSSSTFTSNTVTGGNGGALDNVGGL
jgi:predicted outer membrane repeat protein